MHPRVRQALTSRRRTLTERETLLEKRGHKLMMAAMLRPTVSLMAETEFLLMAMELSWIRLQKRLIQRHLASPRKPKTR